MGPHARCKGSLVPPAEPFQYPLPATPEPSSLVDFGEVRSSVKALTSVDSDLAPALLHLAYSCAATFRTTDYLGGCNGARIRFHLDSFSDIDSSALEALNPIKSKFGDRLSYADLIVMAGSVAVGEITGEPVTFCGGRTDASASDPDGWEYVSLGLSSRGYDSINGLSKTEFVALEGLVNGGTSYLRSSAASKSHHLSSSSLARHAYAYVFDAALFKADAVKAWELLMSADRFDIEGSEDKFCKQY